MLMMNNLIFLLLLSSTAYADKIYIALNDSEPSKNIRKSLYTNYLEYGSDDVWLDLDFRRNQILDSVVVINDFAIHEQSQCPQIKLRELDYWQRVPGNLPDFVLWLDFFEYCIDEKTYNNRVEKWERFERLKMRAFYYTFDYEKFFFKRSMTRPDIRKPPMEFKLE